MVMFLSQTQGRGGGAYQDVRGDLSYSLLGTPAPELATPLYRMDWKSCWVHSGWRPYCIGDLSRSSDPGHHAPDRFCDPGQGPSLSQRSTEVLYTLGLAAGLYWGSDHGLIGLSWVILGASRSICLAAAQ